MVPIFLAAVVSGRAQDEGPAEPAEIITVAEATADADGDSVVDRNGERVSLRGVLTSDPLRITSTSALANMQDESGGILVFTRNPGILMHHVKAGDEVLVSGVIGQYEGAEQITATEVTFLREAGVPAPVSVTTQELGDETFAGRLIRISGRLEVLDRDNGRHVQAILRDQHGEVGVFIPKRFYEDPRFVRQLLSIPSVEMVGILSQSDVQPPFDSNYRLVPRLTSDLKFHPDPPYRAMLVTISVGILVIASLLLLQSRRTAEKSAEEMRKLTEELRLSEQTLRESQNRLRLLTQQVPAIVWTVDRAMRFTSSAGAALNALNLKQDQVVGLSLFDYFQTDDLKSPPIAAHRRAINGRSTRFQADWAGRQYECHVEPLRDAEGHLVGAIGLALDITARRQAEKELQERSDALRHSQKMEAVGRLAGGVAHDFNNLVTVIKGYCDLISLKLGPDNDLQDWFHEIKDSANRAASLTTQLLAFSRKQVLEPRVLDLNEILADMNKLLCRIIGEHIELVTDLAPNLGPVKVDKGQIEQVIMNLAVNAYDAMPKGGRLTLSTADYKVTESGSSKRDRLPTGRYAMISFQDTGEGMSKDVQSRIFEPFFTTKDVGKGTGLGLATVYGVVSQSGGYVEVESEIGKGTTFRVFFPVIQKGQSEEAKRPRIPLNTRGSETVLVAEDEAAVRLLIRQTLEDKGYRVLEAATGAEALEMSRDLPETIDCLVTDVVMPKMSGFKLVEEIVKARANIKVLYVSGYAYTGRHQGGRISPDTFLAKPFSPEMLSLKVRHLLNQAAAVPSQA
jgi:PAS domain S-box-containing protein